MTTSLDAAATAVAEALDAISDPIERDQAVPTARAKVDEELKGVRQRIAVELYNRFGSWRAVGEAMGGVSAQRAWQISRGE